MDLISLMSDSKYKCTTHDKSHIILLSVQNKINSRIFDAQ